jgi:hypothetical protein
MLAFSQHFCWVVKKLPLLLQNIIKIYFSLMAYKLLMPTRFEEVDKLQSSVDFEILFHTLHIDANTYKNIVSKFSLPSCWCKKLQVCFIMVVQRNFNNFPSIVFVWQTLGILNNQMKINWFFWTKIDHLIQELAIWNLITLHFCVRQNKIW